VTALALLSLTAAALPALLYARNVRLYRPPAAAADRPRVSVLIPARNEEGSIAAAVEAVLASRGVELECVVLDDGSADRTAEIVREIARKDRRVRLETAPPLPAGWAGKQHACSVLASHARHPVLAFLDADVRLAPDALARTAAFIRESDADLVSGFPRQETETPLEKLLIPLIHFLLLGFLPFDRMRKELRPGLGAGCGQVFVTTRAAYDAVGGHAHPLVRASFHDGVKLPRAYRLAGRMTDLCDLTDLATCRMYRTAGHVWNGLAKNAREGLAAPRLILPATLLLFVGQVVPFVTVAKTLAASPLILLGPSAWGRVPDGPALLLFAAACGLAWYPRFDAAARFRQSWFGAAVHPVGIVLLLLVQWYATARAIAGRPVGWKGRPSPPVSSDTP
jgi:hypothetical protein